MKTIALIVSTLMTLSLAHADEHDDEAAGGPVEDVQHGVGRQQAEVVLLARPEAARDPQRDRGLVHGALEVGGVRGPRRQRERPAVSEQAPKGAERNHRELVLRLSEQGALGTADADHAEVHPLDRDGSAQRVRAAEQDRSVSRWLAEMLEGMRWAEDEYEVAMERFLARARQPRRLAWADGRRPTREELHDRPGRC